MGKLRKDNQQSRAECVNNEALSEVLRPVVVLVVLVVVVSWSLPPGLASWSLPDVCSPTLGSYDGVASAFADGLPYAAAGQLFP